MDESVQWVRSRGHLGLDIVHCFDEQPGGGGETGHGHQPLVGGGGRNVENVVEVDLLEDGLGVHQRFLQQQFQAIREDVPKAHLNGCAVVLSAGGLELAACAQ